MADYCSLISRAVANLQENTGEARRALYERAGNTLTTQNRAQASAFSEPDFARERHALEDAIRKVEARATIGLSRDAPTAEGTAASKITWPWQIRAAELERQILDYYNLTIWQSARGHAAIAARFIAIINLLLMRTGLIGTVDLGGQIGILLQTVLLLVLSLFISSGRQWAIIATMLLWTVGKGELVWEAFAPTQRIGDMLYSSPLVAVVANVFWWAWFMGVFYRAFHVERMHRRFFSNLPQSQQKSINRSIQIIRSAETDLVFLDNEELLSMLMNRRGTADEMIPVIERILRSRGVSLPG